MITSTSTKRDLLDKMWFNAIAYWLPIAAIFVSGSMNVETVWRTAIWTAGSAMMGAACLTNAVRCGRMHCYFTGPYFLGVAAITLLYGFGMLPLGENGWSMIGLALLVGGIGLMYVPEMVLGRYRQNSGTHPH